MGKRTLTHGELCLFGRHALLASGRSDTARRPASGVRRLLGLTFQCDPAVFWAKFENIPVNDRIRDAHYFGRLSFAVNYTVAATS